jgi:hypothetical protein
VYEEGDEVFLIGFSRGAYTARSLGGMIAAADLPTASCIHSPDDAFSLEHVMPRILVGRRSLVHLLGFAGNIAIRSPRTEPTQSSEPI